MDIFEAIKNNDIARVKELLDLGIDVNIKDEVGYSPPLLEAIDKYNEDEYIKNPIALEIFKLLLEQPNIDINIQNNFGETSLYKACTNNNIDIVKLLLQHPDIDVNKKNIRNFSPLFNSYLWRNIEIIKLLLAHPNIDVNLQNNKKETCLVSACKLKKIKEIELLLAHPDIDVNLQDIEGETPLHALFTHHGQLIDEVDKNNIFNLILKNPKVDINIKNNENKSILSLVLNKKNYSSIIFKKLLNNPNLIIDKNDSSILENVMIYTSQEEVYLLVNKFKVTKLSYDILFLLYNYGKYSIIKYILKTPILINQININIKDNNKNTILHLFCYNDSDAFDIAKTILKHPDIDVNIKDKDGNSPLVIACKLNNKKLVKILLSNPNIKIDFDYNDKNIYISKYENKNILINLNIRSLLKSHTHKYKTSINKILDSIED